MQKMEDRVMREHIARIVYGLVSPCHSGWKKGCQALRWDVPCVAKLLQVPIKECPLDLDAQADHT